jgi:competence protein ComEA
VGSLSRSQLVVYGAVAVVLLLVGARWIRSGDTGGTPAGPVTYGDGGSATSDSSSGGGFSVDAEGGSDVVVDVAGAVSDPGVYRLPAGSRVNDALQRAGGPTHRASVDAINLAARLSDGQQVVVPERTPRSAAAVTSAGGSPGEDNGPVSMGAATVEQLDTIEGIGPVTAQKILEFRDEHGGISSIDQLDQIDGIGPATMETLRSNLQP